MSTSLTPEQVAEQALREKAEVEAQLKYVQRQLGQLMEEKKRGLWNSKSSSKHRDSDDSEGSNPMSDSSEDEFEQRSRRHQRPRERGYGDFKVDIPEFEGQLDPDIFLDWLQTVERVFEYKDIPEGKKVKLVALKLRKYASIWWSNVVSKRVRKGKSKIKTWEQMKSKLEAKFLPPHYLQDNFLKLYHLKQGSKSVEEYTRDFKQLLLKCDLKGDDSQTLIRYLSGLDEQTAHVVELHPYTSLDELSALAHKVEKQKKLKGKNPIFKPTPRPYGFQKPPYTPQKPSPPPNLKPSQTATPQTPSKPPPKPLSKVRCFRCQGLGHYASECPNKRMVSLTEYQASSFLRGARG